MIRAFFASRHWWLFAYGGGAALLASLYYQVHFSVLINSWYGSFYNLLQEAAKHNVSELWEGIEAFLWLAIPYVLLATITGYATRLYVPPGAKPSPWIIYHAGAQLRPRSKALNGFDSMAYGAELRL